MTTATVDSRTHPMAKDRKKPAEEQITFRISKELHGELQATATDLELDISSLLRMMIREFLPEVSDRAAKIKSKWEARDRDD